MFVRNWILQWFIYNYTETYIYNENEGTNNRKEVSDKRKWKQNSAVYTWSEIMKQTSHTIRIGKIPRRPPSQKLHEHQSSSNVQEQTNHQPIEEQVCEWVNFSLNL